MRRVEEQLELLWIRVVATRGERTGGDRVANATDPARIALRIARAPLENLLSRAVLLLQREAQAGNAVLL